MFDKLVTYHIHQRDPLPANDALAYQYVLAGNGVFVRAETRFFTALLPIAASTVRGLPPLRAKFQMHVPCIPARLLADARRARRPDGGRPDNGLNEVLYQFHHHGRVVQVKKPAQQTTPTSVTTAVTDAAGIICDLHSHLQERSGSCPSNFLYRQCGLWRCVTIISQEPCATDSRKSLPS